MIAVPATEVATALIVNVFVEVTLGQAEFEAVTEKIVSLYTSYVTEWEKVAANIEKQQIPYEVISPQPEA